MVPTDSPTENVASEPVPADRERDPPPRQTVVGLFSYFLEPDTCYGRIMHATVRENHLLPRPVVKGTGLTQLRLARDYFTLSPRPHTTIRRVSPLDMSRI